MDFLNLEELAKYLKIKPWTLRQWIFSGVIPKNIIFRPTSRTIRFPKNLVDQWVAEKTGATPNPSGKKRGRPRKLPRPEP